LEGRVRGWHEGGKKGNHITKNEEKLGRNLFKKKEDIFWVIYTHSRLTLLCKVRGTNEGRKSTSERWKKCGSACRRRKILTLLPKKKSVGASVSTKGRTVMERGRRQGQGTKKGGTQESLSVSSAI